MNTRQRERVADLGRAFQSALEEIIDMGEGDIQEEVIRERVYEEDISPVPVDMNSDLALHDIKVKQVHNGFFVGVGCQTFVFESFDKLSKYMKMYFENPSEVTKMHYDGKLFK